MSKVPRPIVRSRSRFFEDPSSVKNAVRLIIVVTVLAVFIGSLVIWLVDHRDFPDYGTALWFSLQTVTTVGYGDVTPTTFIGRLIAGVVMVTAIGFIAVFTAAITSTFVEAARRSRGTADEVARQDADDRMHLRFDELSRRLDRIERRLGIEEEAPVHPTTERPTEGANEPTT